MIIEFKIAITAAVICVILWEIVKGAINPFTEIGPRIGRISIVVCGISFFTAVIFFIMGVWKM